MIRKIAVWLLATLLLAIVSSAKAQQPTKVPRIGLVTASGPEGPNIPLFRQGLRDLGYIEGKNILVEYRGLEGRPDRSPDLIADLVQLNVDVIVVSPITAIRVAKQAT